MFLRSLTPPGFKSFAEKTTLEFAPGISVIVGPNGSGKSNLVDAISWVLGEQGPRALRGGQMADVIFAGSPKRPALGMAEVKLVIDNSAGLIDVPMSEIEISRAIFREGESEYRIGGRVVRLLDVQELLSESGIGRALHTVVGQGQLEEVLSARPEERRTYIEEAAGIAKHRRRKERAERKLAGLEQDLLRLHDVLAELKRQLKPLKQQAEVARRHEELTAQAEAVAARLAAARLRMLVDERERRRSGWEEGLARRAEARGRLEDLDGLVGRAADERARAVWSLQEADAELREAQSARSAAETTLRAAVRAEADARQSLAEEATRGARLGALEEDRRRIESRVSEIVAELEARERELDEAERAFLASAEERRAIEEERRRISEEAAAHRAEIERLDAEVGPLAEERGSLERERHGLADSVGQLEEAVRAHRHRREILLARLKELRSTPGSRFLETHGHRSRGRLGDMVRAEEGWERALAAGLGAMSDAVVYGDEDAAVTDAGEGDGAILAIAGGGPASFVLPGERTLLSIVTAEPEVRGLICTVLKDVYLAETLDEAVRKRSRHPKASFVTPSGVLLGPAVVRTTAEPDARGREIRAELSVVEHDLAQAEAKLRPKRARLEEIARRLDELVAAIETADAAITSAAGSMAQLERDLDSLATEEDLLGQRLAGMDEASAAWRDRLATTPPSTTELPPLPAHAVPPIQARVAVETLRRDRSSLQSRLAGVRGELETLAAQDPKALAEALGAAEAARSAAETSLAEAEAAFEAASSRWDEIAARERSATEAEAEVNRRWREASTELDRLREAYEDDDRSRGDLERRIRDAEWLVREGHGRDPEEALAELTEEDTVEALERRAELIQRRLGLLGRVNLLATGELESLQERHDFLARELDDVRTARRDLLGVIERIELEITTTFEEAYRDVAAEFERLIADLFPGGEGRLVSTTPGDPLNTGIEIEARPGRKRVRRISLLSGGERALVAMAFLFAIFRTRPSPFYLLDEVEPALDDVNLHRFLELLQGFAADSQVLIVTHQKRTMEIAAMLYGVSMGKDGTSRVVAQRLEQPDEAAELEVPAAAEPEPAGSPVH